MQESSSDSWLNLDENEENFWLVGIKISETASFTLTFATLDFWRKLDFDGLKNFFFS